MKLRKNKLRPLTVNTSGVRSALPRHLLDQWDAIDNQLQAWVTSTQSIGGTSQTYFLQAVQRPVKLLEGYSAGRSTSLLGAIFRRANDIHAHVDRMVILAPPQIRIAIEAIQRACCQPNWNELSRGDRGSKPKLTLVDSSLDNDEVQGVLHMLGAHQDRVVTDEGSRWGVLVFDPTGDTTLSHLFLERFLPTLRGQLRDSPELVSRCAVAVTNKGTPLFNDLKLDFESGPEEVGLEFTTEASPDAPIPYPYAFSNVFQTATLLPAAILGVNVMEVLAGAAHISHTLLEHDSSNTIVRDLAVANLLTCAERNCDETVRHIKFGGQGLASLSRWYAQLIEAILPHHVVSSTASRTTQNRNTYSERRGIPSIHHCFETSEYRFDPLNLASGDSLPALTASAMSLETQLLTNQKIPFTYTTLPIVDELSCGQLMQWVLLATLLELSFRNESQREPTQ